MVGADELITAQSHVETASLALIQLNTNRAFQLGQPHPENYVDWLNGWLLNDWGLGFNDDADDYNSPAMVVVVFEVNRNC